MPYLGENIKKLGFGLMRLPMIGDEIDLEQTKRMADLFLEKGFNYFDTAYGYIEGKSEKIVKPVLVDRYPRESFLLATKLPAWDARTAEQAKQMLFTSLERTGAGYFDFYLLHNLGVGRSKVFDDFGIWDFLAEQKEKGLIRHLGFSCHSRADFLDDILTAHPEMEFVQLQINYADWESESIESRKCYEVARKHNKPIIIMEPVKGGVLANLPESVGKILKAAAPDASEASWALRFGASLDGIITVLSGMSSLEQMEENLAFMDNFAPLTPSELKTIERASVALEAIDRIPCTGCGYCLKDCPQNINIPGILDCLNFDLVYDDLDRARREYVFASSSADASDCIACGQCESVCPQSIKIIDHLARAAEVLEK
ncbi:MAG: aldo/keto reductase [Oscillospiraceae bacterium]|jgi:predicted aldo/keto reductase-like oxidoreductase|nr:aldo/keto reductase [Oscillospiraceae bacterium]